MAAEGIRRPGGLPGPERVDLGLLPLACPGRRQSEQSATLRLNRPDRRGPPGSRGTYGALRVHAELSLGRGIAVGQRHRAADAPRRHCRRHRPAQMAPCKPDQRRRPGRPPVHPQRPEPAVGDRHHRAPHPRRARCTARSCWTPLPPQWSAGRSTPPTAALVTNALGMAIDTRTHRRDDDPLRPRGAVHLLGVHPARQGLGAGALDGQVGDCYDNAMIEAFWSRMQVELLTAAAGRPGRARQRDLRVPGDLPQPAATPQQPGHAHPDTVREHVHRGMRFPATQLHETKGIASDEPGAVHLDDSPRRVGRSEGLRGPLEDLVELACRQGGVGRAVAAWCRRHLAAATSGTVTETNGRRARLRERLIFGRKETRSTIHGRQRTA